MIPDSLQAHINSFEEQEKKYRRLTRNIRSERLLDAWADATVQERKQLLNLLKLEDDEGVREWILATSKDPLEAQSIVSLRETARIIGIHRYSRFAKDQLISEIKKWQKSQSQK